MEIPMVTNLPLAGAVYVWTLNRTITHVVCCFGIWDLIWDLPITAYVTDFIDSWNARMREYSVINCPATPVILLAGTDAWIDIITLSHDKSCHYDCLSTVADINSLQQSGWICDHFMCFSCHSAQRIRRPSITHSFSSLLDLSLKCYQKSFPAPVA